MISTDVTNAPVCALVCFACPSRRNILTISVNNKKYFRDMNLAYFKVIVRNNLHFRKTLAIKKKLDKKKKNFSSSVKLD